jgi:protein-L-isoaspartate O-methyltransferase
MPEIPGEFVNTWKPLIEAHLEAVELDGLEIKYPVDSWALFVDGFNWMNTNPIDVMDHSSILNMTGTLLLTGLGLGVGVVYALHNEAITAITVVEKDQRVVDAIVPLLRAQYPEIDAKLTVVVADADTYALDRQYDYAFLDHHVKHIPDGVAARYHEHCRLVVTWWNEVQMWVG